MGHSICFFLSWLHFTMLYKVQYAKYIPFFSDFAGSLRAQKPKKLQTKQARISGSRVFPCFSACIDRGRQLRLLSFILSLFYFLAIYANFRFSLFRQARNRCRCCDCDHVSVLPDGTPSPPPSPPLILHPILWGRAAYFVGRSLVVDRDGYVVWSRPLAVCRGWDTVVSF